jgi:thiamine-monophosphate kinase
MPERELIEAVERALTVRGDRVLRAAGDDAAVVRAAGVAVTSIDSVVDGVHFERATHSPADIGHKALARGLSDIAAMGAEPGEAYVALGVPDDLDTAAALELVEGMEALAERTGTTIAGGDVSAAPVLAVTVSATGWAASPDELAYRDGARAGHIAGVTGDLGAAAAGLAVLRGAGGELSEAEREELVRRHRRPEPRLAAGRALAGAGAGAMIDLSDGIAADGERLCERSGVAIELRLEALPVAAGVEAVAGELGRDPLEFAATGGDDYELLLTAPPERRDDVERAAREAGTWVRWLGRVEPGAGLRLVGPGGRVAGLRGFEHG